MSTLVLGSGGFNNFSLLGLLVILENSGKLYKFDTLVGVSSSSIIVLLTSMGISIRDIIDLAIEHNFFMDFHNFSLEILLASNSPISLEPIRNVVRKLLMDRFGKIPTFYEFYKITHKSPVFITWNNTLYQQEILSPSTTPHLSVLEGLFFSMNIPFLFYKVIYHNQHYLDGTLANPYPVLPFDKDEKDILGCYIHTKPRLINNFNGYMSQIFHAFLENRYLDILQHCSQKVHHLDIYIKDTSNIEQRLDKIAYLLNTGYQIGYSYIFEQKVKNILPRLEYNYLEPYSP